ncbi:WD repeat protein [Rhizodiscina lignyota]|uniref:Serine-threonine kinase receptor-associated protein n=1 Tax=Rhizodiscina lignyota TaxID=1504668 RepID=A0A9P4ILJ6_9PEZI|nr:WD repeat protein [Rhizodiscina lignyota]
MAPDAPKWVPLTCHGHSRPVTHIHFSSIVDDDAYYLVSACKDNNPMLRNGVNGDWIGTFLGHKGAVWQARLSSDATLAATGSADFSAHVWDTFTGEALHTLPHAHIVRAVAFPNQPRPQILATGGMEKKLRIFDLSQSSGATSSPGLSPTNSTEAAKPTPPSFEIGPGVHEGTIKSIVWATDLNILITAADDKKVRWWDLRTRSPIGEYVVEGTVGTCELNLDLPALSSGAATLDNGDLQNGTTPHNTSIGTPGVGTLSVAAGKSVYFFDGASPATLLKQVKTPYEIASVAVHSGQRRFVTGGAGDTYMRVWDYDTEQELEMGKGHHGPIWSVAFSPDGKLYATGSEDGTIKLWNNAGGSYGLWKDR